LRSVADVFVTTKAGGYGSPLSRGRLVEIVSLPSTPFHFALADPR
jgi:hypothetical protein